jgi:hypothetical protein
MGPDWTCLDQTCGDHEVRVKVRVNLCVKLFLTFKLCVVFFTYPHVDMLKISLFDYERT